MYNRNLQCSAVLFILIMGTKLTHDIILGTSQLAKSSHYNHDVKEQDSAFPLAQQYHFAQNNRSLVVIIGFIQYNTLLYKTRLLTKSTINPTIRTINPTRKQYIFSG